MRILAIVLITAGIVALIYTGFSFTTKKKVADIGPIDINKKEKHSVSWSPIAGVLLLIGGIALFLVDKKR
jgi:LPXTG-motif cell wall-anchored protein